MKSNCNSKNAVLVSLKDEFDYYEMLPPSIRRLLRYTELPRSSEQIYRIYRTHGIANTIKYINSKYNVCYERETL